MTRSRWTAVGAVAAVVVVGVALAWAVARPRQAMSPAAPVATTTETAGVATQLVPTPTEGPATATASATPTVREQVVAAYLASWSAYTQAVRHLDASLLDPVMTGPMLQRTRAEIADLQKQGRAMRIVVEHHYVVARLDAQAGTATVVDDYVNRSYFVDAASEEPIGAAPTPDTLSDTFYLVREDGTWKVRDSVRTVVVTH